MLEFLGAMIDLMPGIETPHGYARRLSGWPEYVPRHRINAEVTRMKKRGWIDEAEKKGKKFIKLTEKGRLAILYRKLKAHTHPSNRKWDGSWWMAIYDIPEKGRAQRKAICRALCSGGFRYLQKSVYVYPFKLPNDLVAYLKAAKLLPYIRFMCVDYMDGARKIEKYFKVRKPRGKHREY